MFINYLYLLYIKLEIFLKNNNFKILIFNNFIKSLIIKFYIFFLKFFLNYCFEIIYS